jgi:hypothetical protein
MPYSDKETVIKTIKESFEDAVYPGDDNLFSDFNSLDILAFSEILRGKHWKETLSILEKQEGAALYFYEEMFYLLTPEALHYFTPAFLIIAMDPESDMVGDHFEHQLKPNGSEWQTQRFSQLIPLFSDRQKHAVTLAVDYMHGEYKEDYRRLGQDCMVQYLEFWSQWIK